MRVPFQSEINRCFQISEAMQTKFPATNTMIYSLASSDNELVESPMMAPTTASMFITPLEQIVCHPLNLLFSNMATSPNYLGIQWMKMATTIGMYTVESPVEKASPIERPSIVLWMDDPMRLRYPALPLPLRELRHPGSASTSLTQSLKASQTGISQIQFSGCLCVSYRQCILEDVPALAGFLDTSPYTLFQLSGCLCPSWSSSTQCWWTTPNFIKAFSRPRKAMMDPINMREMQQLLRFQEAQAQERMWMTASPSRVPQAREKKNLINPLKMPEFIQFLICTRRMAAANPSSPSPIDVRRPNPHRCPSSRELAANAGPVRAKTMSSRLGIILNQQIGSEISCWLSIKFKDVMSKHMAVIIVDEGLIEVILTVLQRLQGLEGSSSYSGLRI